MSQQSRSTFVVTDPSEILQALVGLKDVRVLHYERRGPDVELVIEQIVADPRCPSCRGPAQVKERPLVSYVDLPVFGQPMRLGWRKHRMACLDPGCPRRSFVRLDGHSTNYATTVCDVEHHQIIDILPSRNYVDVARFIDKQPKSWKERVRFGALDMSATYAAVYSVVLPKAAQVVDPFHVVSLANRCLDQVRRRVQQEQKGHRGRRDDPLDRARRALLVGEERLGEKAGERLWSLLSLGDPNAEVAIAYRVKERLRDFYRCGEPEEARQILDELANHCTRAAHATRGTKARQDLSSLVREDLELPSGEDAEWAHRSAQQLDQADQTRRLRVPQLRELPHPGATLRGQAKLAGARLDRRPMRFTPPESDEPITLDLPTL